MNLLHGAIAAHESSKGYYDNNAEEAVDAKSANKLLCAKLPGDVCYMSDLRVVSGYNTYNKDIEVVCTNGKQKGCYIKSALTGSDDEAIRAEPVLYVLHPNSNFHSDEGKKVHQMDNSGQESKFAKYAPALTQSLDSHATPIQNTNMTEYVSPSMVLLKDSKGTKELHEATSDYLPNVFYKNPGMFQDGKVECTTHEITRDEIEALEDTSEKRRLQAIRNSLDAQNKHDVTMHRVSFRCKTKDYDKLIENVTSEVLDPLKANLITLHDDKEFQVSLQPAVGSVPVGDNGASLWKTYNKMRDVTPGCTVFFLHFDCF